MKFLTAALYLSAFALPSFADQGLAGNWQYAMLGYSRHSVTFSPEWKGYKDSYTGNSGLWPTLSIQGFGENMYAKGDL